MSENKKIKNATTCSTGDVKFKSQLEKSVYNTLHQLGFNPQYEPKTFVLIDKFNPITPFYDKESDSQYNKRKKAGDSSARKLVKKEGVIQSIKYTPDFYFKYGTLDVYIEVKGFENDCFYLKKKLFRRYLDTQPEKSIYFEIYTKKQLLQAVEIIKEYEQSLSNSTGGN